MWCKSIVKTHIPKNRIKPFEAVQNSSPWPHFWKYQSFYLTVRTLPCVWTQLCQPCIASDLFASLERHRYQGWYQTIWIRTGVNRCIHVIVLLRDVPVEIYGGAMVILEKNSLPSNIKKNKNSPLFNNKKKFSPPWWDKNLCPPVIWSHIFHRHRNIPLFRSISLVDTKKNPLRGILNNFILNPISTK